MFVSAMKRIVNLKMSFSVCTAIWTTGKRTGVEKMLKGLRVVATSATW